MAASSMTDFDRPRFGQLAQNGASSEHADEAIRNPQKDAHETDQNDERTEDEAL
jgi:hypothetical protein